MQNIEMLISVIVPVYKVEEFLPRCIDSILNQSYHNTEVILVDDGSPDRCGDICDEYKDKDSRVIVIHKQNGGLSDARNAGTDIAKGKILTYVDSDDWLHRDFLKTLYELMISTSADVVVCSHHATSNVIQDYPISNQEISVYEGKEIEELLWATVDVNNKLHRDMVVAWGKLYRRETIGKVRYPLGRIHEDNFVTHKLFFAASKVAYTPAQLVYYFRREDSITGRGGFNVKHRLDMLDSYEDRADYFLEKGYPKIANLCNRNYFLRVFNIDHYLENYVDIDSMIEIKKKRHLLKHKLRNGNFKFTFRIFFELYYLSPKLFLMFYRLWK